MAAVTGNFSLCHQTLLEVEIWKFLPCLSSKDYLIMQTDTKYTNCNPSYQIKLYSIVLHHSIHERHPNF